MSRRILFAVLLAAASAAASAATTRYTLDPNHTQVMFTYSHFGYSHPTGQFDGVTGTLDYDAADPDRSSVRVSIPMNQVNTHVPALDEHLESPDFFDAAKYPTATFVSTKVERGAAEGQLKVSGDLTLHGTTRPVVLEVTLNKAGEHGMWKAPALGFDAAATLSRSQFGVKMYVPAVSDAVQLRISTEAIESKAYAAATQARPAK
ncbi:MAG: YceI family protein [Mizugakiibacter sp.]|uniref:YceI family protein n=1 Tax=Mizugakiibacter sp. TaxID=1972610 RepID=UPI0031C8063D|nr:YceI family protein [Xanthomonadaceae bacterium]